MIDPYTFIWPDDIHIEVQFDVNANLWRASISSTKNGWLIIESADSKAQALWQAIQEFAQQVEGCDP